MSRQTNSSHQQSLKARPARMQVISAVPFRDEQKKRLAEALEKRFPDQSFDLEFITDKDMLGGVCLKTQSFVLDAGYKKQLAALYASVFSKKDS